MDVTCSVEDNDHQEAPFSAPEVPPTAEDQQMEDVLPQDQDSPVSPSADDSPSHLLRHLDCDKITRNEGHELVQKFQDALPWSMRSLDLLSKDSCHRHPGAKDSVRAASEINVNVILNATGPGPAELSEVRVTRTTDVTAQATFSELLSPDFLVLA
ncbi:serine threonine- kinase pim-1-like protein [Labeo rohita]|uniref:Serine threonine-kinase pim-1-like protein n=1 Tax=Labeo rohita TaxID=84645 RepID=A0A498LMA6_LABRO|nr:serine threonine- kinase pim-1-like protein [Labeo rohita]